MSRRWTWLLFLLLPPSLSQAWFISAPTSKSDWQELSNLVVQTFDAPPADAPKAERLRWQLWDQTLAVKSTYRKFVSTARKLKGSKYAILICKRWDRVVGMAEVGVVVAADERRRRPTIGLLCVDEAFQKQGVGVALVHKSCDLVANVWKEDALYAEVEATNLNGVTFFESCGFVNNNGEQVMVNLRRGRSSLEERPHLLLYANLTNSAVSTDEEAAEDAANAVSTEE